MLIAGLLLGLLGLAASTVGIVTQFMPRRFSEAQRAQITAWEISKRWRTWPAGQIFPASVGYTLMGSAFGTPDGLPLVARRVGIAPQASCGVATDSEVGRVLHRHGCQAVLRATYDDQTQTLAVTVGVAVLPSGGAARNALEAFPSNSGMRPGVKAVPFHRTAVARFGDRQRRLSWQSTAGPYLVLATVGYANGRPWLPNGDDAYTEAELLSLASGVGHSIAASLSTKPPQPRCPGSPAC